MVIEKQKNSLIPKPGQTLEEARDRYFTASWPPKANGDLPGYKPSPEAARESIAQAVNVKSTRKMEQGRMRKVMNYGAVLVAAAGITAATTELANVMGNQEHSPWDKPVPAQASHR